MSNRDVFVFVFFLRQVCTVLILLHKENTWSDFKIRIMLFHNSQVSDGKIKAFKC